MKLSKISVSIFLSSACGAMGVSRRQGREKMRKPKRRSLLPQLVTYDKNAMPAVLGLCEGKCKSDDDCGEGLICFKRDKNERVPQCEGGELDDSKNDFCIYEFTSSPVATTSVPSLRPSAAPSSAPSEKPLTAVTSTETSADHVRAVITKYSLGGGVEFDDVDSYQSKALARTAEQSGVEQMTEGKIVQYYALYCIYMATNGVRNIITDSDPRFIGIQFPTWNNDRNWNKNNVDPCDDWYGIECDENGVVTGVDLYSNVLTGSFPPEVKLLASDGPYGVPLCGSLNRLDLFDNEFLFNNQDNAWMSDLGSNLEYFYFQHTGFAGALPKLPSNLIEFDCSWSLINGGLNDHNFAGMNALEFIVLEGNAFSTSVPSVFSTLPSLKYFYLSDSYITGDLSFMQDMPEIVELWIDHNPHFTGEISSWIGELTTLQSLSIADNNLVGTLPTELGNLSSLVQLWTYSNNLVGTIPDELGGIPRLKILQVEGNQLTGMMPGQLCFNVVGSFGFLETLGSDCGEVSCNCCTCCGVEACDPYDN